MEETSFPRGGRSLAASTPKEEAKKPLSHKRSHSEKRTKDVASDFLFGKTTETTKKRKVGTSPARSGASAMKHSLLPLGGGGVVMVSQGKNKHQEPNIEALSFGKLAKGTKLLGIVREVRNEFAVLSLPNLLTGYILQEGLPLSQCLSVGQYLAVVVNKIVTENLKGGQQRRRIQVSAKPSDLNSTEAPSRMISIRGQIVSIEDHGCQVDLGYRRKGFLAFDQVEGGYTVVEDDEAQDDENEDESKGKILQKGRLYDFFVTSSKSDALFSLSLPSAATMSKHVIVPTSTTPPLSSICPGWLVQAKMESLAKNGLCVTFFGNVFRGAIDLGHTGGYFVPQSRDVSSIWRDVFTTHQSFTARILAVDVATKLIRLSIQPHLLRMNIPKGLPDVGVTVEECTVLWMDPGIGALLALPSEPKEEGDEPKKSKAKGIYASEAYREASKVKAVYVHISKAIDDKDAPKFAKLFAPSTTHKVRILSSLNWIDGVASGACAPSIVDAHVLTHSDLKPGQIYRQVPVCAQLNGGNILVNLGADVRGLITQLHLFETAASSEYRRMVLQAKYKVDSKIDVRVLWVDPVKKKCLLTAKKGLLKPKTLITSYDEIQVGQTAAGFISRIDDKEMYVTFGNRVHGKVTARSLAAELGIENHRDDYNIGDVVTCRIVKKKKRSIGDRRRRFKEQEAEDDESDEDTGRAYYDVTLSLDVQDKDGDTAMEKTEDSEERTPKQVHIRAGTVLPSKSMKIVELVPGKQKAKGGFVPGYAIVSLKTKYLVNEAECAGMLPHTECKLSYDQLMDEYDPASIESSEALDALAERLLTVGKKINQRGIILTDPQKSNVDYSNGIGQMTVLSIRNKLVEAAVQQNDQGEVGKADILLPRPDTELYVGASLLGFVAHKDAKHGSFIRFLDGMTGLIPKSKSGLNVPLFATVVTRVEAIDDSTRPMKILLKNLTPKFENDELQLDVAPGEKLAEAQVVKLDFYQATLKVPSQDAWGDNVRVTIHCTQVDSPVTEISRRKHKAADTHSAPTILKGHPFYKWKVGQNISNLTVLSVQRAHKGFNVHVGVEKDEERDDENKLAVPAFVKDKSELVPGMFLTGLVSRVAENNSGVHVLLSPSVMGFIPALELSTDVKILNDIASYIPIGSRLRFCVVDGKHWRETRSKCPHVTSRVRKEQKSKDHSADTIFLSVIRGDPELQDACLAPQPKPSRSDCIVGRVNRSLHQILSPSLMLDLRGGYVGRCDITELDEVDEWVNLPLGRTDNLVKKNGRKDSVGSEGSAGDDMETDLAEGRGAERDSSQFPHGKYVTCRVLKPIPGQSIVDVSLRPSRIEGDLDDDEPPAVGDTVPGYVIRTNKSGCFIRTSRQIEGRVSIKELCDGFLPDPAASFPPGRLVVGKVKEVHEAQRKKGKPNSPARVLVDLDMRESTLLNPDKLSFDAIELNSKHRGTVTRVEPYGIFVRIENSDVSGLVHKSECSDKFVKNLDGLYDPGDLVKVLVIKSEAEGKKLGLSMKPSHFADDDDSDDDSSVEDPMEEDADQDFMHSNEEGSLDSDDENFGAKLAAKMQQEEGSDDSSDDDSDSSAVPALDKTAHESSASEGESDDESDDETPKKSTPKAFDMDVGFDWGPTVHSASSKAKDGDNTSDDGDSSSESEEEEDDNGVKSSHKSRKQQARRRREEQEIAHRETALADGTADQNPETAADFERLIAGNPNASEIWIRYMAWFLSLADIPSARSVANRAFERIEFRQEQEKLNVWTALLTLELKYGDGDSLQACIDRACQQNNPKHVYLRVCELLEKDLESSSSPSALSRADEMFEKMCKKFKSKKQVWIVHMQFLLKHSRQQDAHKLLKRALMSLPAYKHAETMSKFAQSEFEFGSPERARTVFHGILLKYPKRLDLFLVYLDKEIKHGSIVTARVELEKKVHPPEGGKAKISDKQMKSLFKKWYRIEEQHGTDETREHVKNTARAYVNQTST